MLLVGASSSPITGRLLRPLTYCSPSGIAVFLLSETELMFDLGSVSLREDAFVLDFLVVVYSSSSSDGSSIGLSY